MKRFWDKVNKDGPIVRAELGPCWLWQASLDKDGYGKFWINGRDDRAHRVSWVLHRDAIESGKMVCHKCDNPRCCNPNHLFLGNAIDNNGDSALKGRRNWKISKIDIELLRFTFETLPVTVTELATAFGIKKAYAKDLVGGVARGYPAERNPSWYPKGHRSGACKLTARDVAEIKRELADGAQGRVLARRYGVNETTISKIGNGKTWVEQEAAAS